MRRHHEGLRRVVNRWVNRIDRAAREALEQAEGSYRVGLATNLERLTAQSALLSAELQLASERFDQALLLMDLTRFTGRLGANSRSSFRGSGSFPSETTSGIQVGTSGFNTTGTSVTTGTR